MRRQRTVVLLKSRFESDLPSTKGAEIIAALWPANRDINSVEADGPPQAQHSTSSNVCVHLLFCFC